MYRTVGPVKFTIENDHEEVAVFSHGKYEENPAFEITSLIVTPMGDFYLLGGGCQFSLWRKPGDNGWNFDCGTRTISSRDALAWAGRYCPASIPKVAAIIAGTRPNMP
jgi:hypothetical protein